MEMSGSDGDDSPYAEASMDLFAFSLPAHPLL